MMLLLLILLAVSVAIAVLIPRDAPRPSRLPAPSPPEVRGISPEDARQRLRSGEDVVLLDVRTPKEHLEKRIPGSVLLPIEPADELSSRIETVVPDKDTPVFVYCRSGRRSANAAGVMAKLGYTNVFDLGGIQSWPFETEEGEAGR